MDVAALAALLEAAIDAISTVIDRVHAPQPDPVAARAKDALTVIGAIIHTVKQGTADPSKAKADLDRLIAAIDVTDEETDRAVDKKFTKTDTPDG